MEDAGPIDIVTRPGDRPPRLPGKVLVRDTAHEAIDALAADVFLAATGAARAHSEVHIAIAVSDAIVPLMRVPGCIKRSTDKTVVDLPQPLSPTSPRTSPRLT